jgi:ribonucleoside-triphosphate reductase (thioredoxin)
MAQLLPTQYQEYIAKSRYARWLGDRREDWNETVARYFDYMGTKVDLTPALRASLESSVANLSTMPSMRLMMTSGLAVERDNISGYNCAYTPIDHPRAFDECLYILMCGTGVGFSVERQYISKLPDVPETLEPTDTIIKVADSKQGWAKALRELIALLYGGQVPGWDTSDVREAGARLKTFGGRASGPGPLEDLFRYVVRTLKGAVGRKLNSREVHGIVCKIGEVVVVGGVRRSALISLSNLSDDRMRTAKSGSWWESNPEYALANNSVAYTEKPDIGSFMSEWKSLYDSKSGERGIFSRRAAKAKAAENGRRDADWDFGTNPCSEIILRPQQFCNLTEAVARVEDTVESLEYKVSNATILGTYQATLTNFKHLRPSWKRNTEEEALLGVSITGIMDSPLLYTVSLETEQLLQHLRRVAVETNAAYAKEFGVAQSAAITCVKPSGTVSQLVDAASGIHPRFAPAYIRTVRGDTKDSLTKFLIDAGVPNEPCAMKPDSTVVFSFPVVSPKGCITVDDMTAIDQLELWLMYYRHWCEHKPSITVYVREHEWLDVGAWVYRHFDDMSGVSFLPHTEHSYVQAPYQPIPVAEAERLMTQMPVIDWSKLSQYETEDNTKSSQTMACVSGVCEIVDV